jgi:hypothetical protein
MNTCILVTVGSTLWNTILTFSIQLQTSYVVVHPQSQEIVLGWCWGEGGIVCTVTIVITSNHQVINFHVPVVITFIIK